MTVWRLFSWHIFGPSLPTEHAMSQSLDHLRLVFFDMRHSRQMLYLIEHLWNRRFASWMWSQQICGKCVMLCQRGPLSEQCFRHFVGFMPWRIKAALNPKRGSDLAFNMAFASFHKYLYAPYHCDLSVSFFCCEDRDFFVSRYFWPFIFICKGFVRHRQASLQTQND